MNFTGNLERAAKTTMFLQVVYNFGALVHFAPWHSFGQRGTRKF